MSDPEDLQVEDKNTDDWIYQLRRIGPPATCPKMPDIMRLNLGLTRIGRGQHNDYYLDSAVLKNFISRSHVEIFGKQNENGETEFILTDKGLNGTFINDIRTHKTCTLEVGDKITFGHTNGYKIQPGSYAEQPLSEFQFQFEKIPRHLKTSEMFSENLQSSTTTLDESREINLDLRKEATIVSDRLFLSDIQSNVVQTQEKSAKSKVSQKGRSRKDSSSHSDNDLDTSIISSVQKGKHGSGKLNSESSSKSPTVETVTSAKWSRGNNKDICSEILPAQEDREIEEEDEEEEEEQETKKRKKGTKKGKSSAPKKASTKKKVVEPPSDSEESSEDDSCKPEADQRPRTQTQTVTRQKPVRRKKTGNDAPAIGSRKRRRKGGAANSSAAASTSDDLEPGVEWYEDDTCDSVDCKRPKKKRTPWVQCDDCDGWYHTVCVGANYKKLKDSDEHFNCGCE